MVEHRGFVAEESAAGAKLTGESNPSDRERIPVWLNRALPGVAYAARNDQRRCVVQAAGAFSSTATFDHSWLLGRGGLIDLCHPDDATDLSAKFQALSPGESFDFEYRVLAPSDQVIWVRDRGRLVAGAHALQTEGCLMDTGLSADRIRKAIEQAELRDEREAALLALATSEAVAGGNVDEVARVASRLSGELIGVARASVWFLSPDNTQLSCHTLYMTDAATFAPGTVLQAADYPRYFSALQTGVTVDAWDAQQDPRTEEFSAAYLCPLGIGAMLDTAIRVAGKVVGILCLEHVGPPRAWTSAEVTFAGRLADQLSHTLHSHDRLQADRERTLFEQRLHRAQRMDALGRMAGGIAHDFNNLLTVFCGNATLIVDPEETTEERIAAGREILDAGYQAKQLIQQLLLLSRNETRPLTRVNLGQILRSQTRLLSGLLGGEKFLAVQLPADPVHVLASESLLHQIVSNLVVNARDAGSPGGAVELAVREYRLSEELAQPLGLNPGDYVSIEVADDGPGIAPASRELVFEPFFTTKGPGQGTGLGLSTVYSIAHQLGGHAEVDDRPGGGALIRVYLPRC